MEQVFSAVAAALRRGEGAALCTILSASGSTPRGPGARMAVFSDGTMAGTIGGGAAERLAQVEARAMLPGGEARVQTFQLTPGGGEDIGMVCGGTIAVAFQTVGPEDLPLVERVCALQAGDVPAWLVTAMGADGNWSMAVWPAEGVEGQKLPAERVRPLLGDRPALAEGEPRLFVEPLTRRGTVYVFGAGHVGLELAWLLDRTGFRTAVLDDRAEALDAAKFPPSVQLLPTDFAHVSLPLTAADCVVIMTAGHRGDLAVLEQVLGTPAGYIGCIGSRKKAAAVQEALKGKGFTEHDIERIHSPIGLPIGGETPAEIAVSIAAQLIAHRAGKEAPHG